MSSYCDTHERTWRTLASVGGRVVNKNNKLNQLLTRRNAWRAKVLRRDRDKTKLLQ